jgi:hypothetical protein
MKISAPPNQLIAPNAWETTAVACRHCTDWAILSLFLTKYHATKTWGVQMEVICQLHAPTALPPMKESSVSIW